MTSEIFNKTFFNRFFPRENREAKVEEIYLFSNYYPFLFSDPKDEMSSLVTRVSDNLKEECC